MRALLATAFAMFTLLPWAHMLKPRCHEACAVDAAVASEPDRDAAHAAAIEGPLPAPDACWVCKGLITIQRHVEATGAAGVAGIAPATISFFMFAPQARVFSHIYPANRSQAPPLAA